MAFREHNANILPPIYTNDTTWSSPHTLSLSSTKEPRVRVDASKENSNLVPYIQKRGTGRMSYVTDIPQTLTAGMQKSKAKNDQTGTETMAVLATRPGQQVTLLPRPFGGGSSRFEQDPPESIRMERLRPAIDPIAIHSATKVDHEHCAQIQVSGKAMPPPGFNNYADAVKSNIAGNLSEKKVSPYINVFEYSCTEKKEVQPCQHFTPLTIQQYGQKIYSLSEHGDRKSAQEAEVVLRDMISKYKTGVHEIQPDGGCYSSVIHAYANVGLPHQAEEVMRLMLREFQNGSKSAEPNVRCFTNVLHAWRKSQCPDAPEKCEALLEVMNEIGNSNTNLRNCKPDAFAITVILHCWIESNRPDGHKQAERLFRLMKNQFNQGEKSMRPDCISYSLLMNAFAGKLMVDNAESILWEMVDDFIVHGNTAAEPRTRNFNTILAMHSRSNLATAPERTENVLRRYRDLCNKNLLQNKPDEYSYSILLKAWTSSSRKDGITQALNRLDWMRGLKEDAALPDTVKYTTIISAFARNGNVSDAEALLNRMVNEYLNTNRKGVQPDVQLFDIVIKAITTPEYVSRSDARRAENHLRNMWSLHGESGVNVRPQATTYKHVIIGYKKAKMPQKADSLLWEMEKKNISTPTKELIQTVMNSWYDSHISNKQQHINALRLLMNDRYICGK